MGRSWSYLFAVVMIACGGICFVAPFLGWWMPQRASTHSQSIDDLFYIILAITGFFFVLTEALLVIFMYQYAARPEGQHHVFGHHAFEDKVFWTSYFKRAFRPVSALLHNQHRVELAWTLVPALILLYIAFAQVNTWATAKYQSHMPQYGSNTTPLQIELNARQFEWRMRYPTAQRFREWMENKGSESAVKDFNSFARVPQKDDVHVVNDLHVFQGQPVVILLGTRDVIHSFNLPNMRVKQDALPGKIIPVWFTPTISNTRLNTQTGEYQQGFNPDTGKRDARFEFALACAELCGWGHYRMNGRVYVHRTEEEFLDWLTKAQENQHRHTAPAPVPESKNDVASRE